MSCALLDTVTFAVKGCGVGISIMLSWNGPDPGSMICGKTIAATIWPWAGWNPVPFARASFMVAFASAVSVWLKFVVLLMKNQMACWMSFASPCLWFRI